MHGGLIQVAPAVSAYHVDVAVHGSLPPVVVLAAAPGADHARVIGDRLGGLFHFLDHRDSSVHENEKVDSPEGDKPKAIQFSVGVR